MECQIVKVETNGQPLVGWLAVDADGNTIGHVFLSIQNNKKIKLLDAWVDEQYRRQGIYRELWETRWKYVEKNYKGYKAYAWCLPKSLPLLIEKEFTRGDTCVYVEKEIL